MPSPTNLKYTKDHEWARLDGAVATVGITDYAQHSLGDVVYVDMGSVGKKVKQHETFGVVESVKAASDLFSPVSGTVSEVNSKLVDTPEIVNQAPYGDGWMIKVKLSDRAELDNLLSAADYDAFVATL
jgi:glycine cleavage system H protein